MRLESEKGNIVTEFLLTFLAISVVIFFFLVPKGGLKTVNTGVLGPQVEIGGTSIGSNGNTYSNPVNTSGSYGNSISLSTSNASYTIDPGQEYITIQNNGRTAVDITGWRIENGKSARVYAVGSQAVHYASDVAILPQGAEVLSPIGTNFSSDIVLKPGERAIVVTGSPGNLSPYRVVSFKENKCTGYLSADYRFTGGLSQSCPIPNQELGARSFEEACSNLIDRIPSCHTPTFDTIDTAGHTTNANGDTCSGCIEGVGGLTNLCTAFIRDHYSYAGCLVNHASDSNFEGNTWHIYLYRPWEMWANSHETVSLYDTAGRLVSSTSY